MPRITYRRGNRWFVQSIDGGQLRERRFGDEKLRSLSPSGAYRVIDVAMGSPYDIDAVFRAGGSEPVFDLADWSDDVHMYGWLSDRLLVAPLLDKTLVIDLESEAIRELPVGGSSLRVSPRGVLALQSDGHAWIVDVNEGTTIDLGRGKPRVLSPDGNVVCVRRDDGHFVSTRPFESWERVEPDEGRIIVLGCTHAGLPLGTHSGTTSFIVVWDFGTRAWRRISRGGSDARPRLHPQRDLVLFDRDDELWVIDDETERPTPIQHARSARWVRSGEVL